MSVNFLVGDCLKTLATIINDSIDCIVTSPPYWGLRDYGTAKWIGGRPDCDHALGTKPRSQRPMGKLGHANDGFYTTPFKSVCGKCGARRVDSQIGLEETLDAYVEKMVEVCRELRRVLKPSGTFWLNIGDTYVSQGGVGQSRNWDGRKKNHETQSMRRSPAGNVKVKDLCLVPYILVVALRNDGWYVRSEIVWHKANPIPESVVDRPTSAHEKVWLLTKEPKYFYDADAIAEKALSGDYGSRNARNVWLITAQPFAKAHFATMPSVLAERCIKAGCPVGGRVLDPFGGAGTTGLAADRLGRHCTLLELNPKYVEIAKQRISEDRVARRLRQTTSRPVYNKPTRSLLTTFKSRGRVRGEHDDKQVDYRSRVCRAQHQAPLES